MANVIHSAKPSFSGGEFAPSLYARTDIQKYATGARKLRNFYVHPHGGISNRPGLKFVAKSKNTGEKVRVIDFQFASDENYVIEFGDKYNRFYTNDAQIYSSGTTPYELVSIYTESELAYIRYAQSADVMFVAHPDFQPRELQRLGNATWTWALYNYEGGPFRLPNDDTTLTMAVSANTGNATLTASAAFFYATHASGTYSTGALMQLNHYIEGHAMSQAISAATISTSIACGGIWRIITHGTWTGTIKVQKSTDSGSTWKDLRQFTGANDFNVDTYGSEDMSDGALPFLVRVNATVLSSGTCNVDLTTDPYEQQGIAKIMTYISTTQVSVSMQRATGSTGTTSNWAEGSWSDYRGWPSAVVFAQDRLIWAGTLSDPQTMFMSQTSNYYNFFRNSPLVDSDGVTVNLPSQKLNSINGLVSLLQLLAFTSGGEWSIGSTQSNVLSPTSMQIKLNSYTGSSGVQPCVIVNRAIYVQSRGAVIRDMGYDLFTDTFSGSNLSILSNHLFTNYSIKEMAYQQDPDSLVWAVRSDGILLCMTYMREQEVLAWTWCDTYEGDDLFESVTCIPATGYNQVWFVVNRGGQRYIERMVQRLSSTARKDQFFVDCGVTYDGSTIPDPYTKLLMHFDTSSFTDEKAHVITNASVTFDIVNQQFGAGAASFGGTAYLSTPDSADFSFGTGNFTISFWESFDEIGKYQGILGQYEDYENYWVLYKNDLNKFGMKFVDGGVVIADYIMTNVPTVTIGTRYHLAFQRNGTGANIFISGASQTLTETVAFSTQDVGDASAPFKIGLLNSTDYVTNGNMETWTGITDLLVNGDMETGSPPSNWTAGGVYLARESVIVKEGTYSGKLTCTGTLTYVVQDVTITSDTAYYIFSCWVYQTAGSGDRAGIVIDIGGDSNTSFHSGSATGWEFLTVRIRNTSKTTATAYLATTNTVGNAYFDYAKLYKEVVTTSWSINGTNACVTREESTIKSGTYSAKLIGTGGYDSDLQQDFTTSGGRNLAFWKGKLVKLGGWVYATVANRAKLALYDGTATVNSSYHTGDSTWQYLTVYQTVSSSATEVLAFLALSGGDTSAFFDDINISEGIPSEPIKGVMDELRLSKGINRWSSNFAVPTSAYTIYGSAAASKVITGLTHLNTRVVSILSDGTVQNQQTVSGGTVTLTDVTSMCHVGLPYNSDLETLNIDMGLADGTLQGRRINISQVILRVANSRGGFIGPSFTNLYELMGDYLTSTDTSLYTGDVKQPLGQGYADGGRFCYRQSDPLPVTILGVFPVFTPGGTTMI